VTSQFGIRADINAGSDVDAPMAVIVVLMMVQDTDEDLNQQMAEAQAQAKQAIRSIINQFNQMEAAISGEEFDSVEWLSQQLDAENYGSPRRWSSPAHLV
jgi:ATP-dependent helicase/DNAse subunit B